MKTPDTTEARLDAFLSEFELDEQERILRYALDHIVPRLKSRAALASEAQGARSAEAPFDVETLKEQAGAWLMVAQTLHEVAPWWTDGPSNGRDSACSAIRRLATHPAHPQVAAVWNDMNCAPLDGTLVRLLVKFDSHPIEDTDAPTATIGSHNDGEWSFVGWDWHRDEWARGGGDLLGWLPMHESTPAPQAREPAEPVGWKPGNPWPPFECWSNNDGDSWRESPLDSDLVDGLKVGDTYELLAGWESVRATYRVTKAPDEESDDYDVECISHQCCHFAAPSQVEPAEPVALVCERCGGPPEEHTPSGWCDNQSFAAPSQAEPAQPTEALVAAANRLLQEVRVQRGYAHSEQDQFLQDIEACAIAALKAEPAQPQGAGDEH